MSFSIGRWSLRKDKSTAQPPPAYYYPQQQQHQQQQQTYHLQQQPYQQPPHQQQTYHLQQQPYQQPPHQHQQPQYHHPQPQQYPPPLSVRPNPTPPAPFPYYTTPQHPTHPSVPVSTPSYNPAVAVTIPTGLQFHQSPTSPTPQASYAPPPLPPRPTSFVGYPPPPGHYQPQSPVVGLHPGATYEPSVSSVTASSVTGSWTPVSSVSVISPSPAHQTVTRLVSGVSLVTVPPVSVPPISVPPIPVPPISVPPISVPPVSVPLPSVPILTSSPPTHPPSPNPAAQIPSTPIEMPLTTPQIPRKYVPPATPSSPEAPIPVDIEALDPTSRVRPSDPRIPDHLSRPAASAADTEKMVVQPEDTRVEDSPPKMYAAFNNYVDDFSVYAPVAQTGEERPRAVSMQKVAVEEVPDQDLRKPALTGTEGLSTPATPVPESMPPPPPPPPPRPQNTNTPHLSSSDTPQTPSTQDVPTPPPVSPPATSTPDLADALASTSLTTWGPDDPLYRRPVIVRPSGPANAIVSECIGGSAVPFTTRYHWHPSVPRFRICTNCFQRVIASTRIASSFTSGDIPGASCFMSPSVEKHLLSAAAINSGDLSPLINFMTSRAVMPACAGKLGTPQGNGYTWYQVTPSYRTGNLEQHMVICSACHADYISQGPFDKHFQLHTDAVQDGQWACDLASPFIAREFQKATTANNWPRFTKAVERRITLPVCSGKGTPFLARGWWTSTRNIPGLWVCEACMLDNVGNTPFMSNFREASTLAAVGQPVKGQPAPQVSCAMASVPGMIAIAAAVIERNIDIFFQAAPALVETPCDGGTRNGGKFYQPHGATNVDFCEACYYGVLVPFGLARFLTPKVHPANIQVACDLHMSRVPGINMFNAAQTAFLTGVVTPFVNLTHGHEPELPLCRGMNLVEGQFYGWSQAFPDTAVCARCYFYVVKDTPLDRTMDRRACSHKTTCCLYSNRQRSIFAAASAANDLAMFLNVCRQRSKIEIGYFQYRLTMENKLMHMKFQANMQACAAMTSVVYGAAAGMAAINKHDNIRYGSASTGWHDTYEGVQAAQYLNKMNTHGAAIGQLMGEAMMAGSEEEDWKKLWAMVE